MSKYNFIYLALARWDGPYASTAWAIAKELANNHHVFYIENPFTLKDLITGIGKKDIRRRLPALIFGMNKYQKPLKDKNLIVVTPLAILPINWLPNNAIYRWLNKINNKLIYRAVRSTIRKYNLKAYISFNSFNPFYGPHFMKHFQPSLSIYQSVDAIEQSEYLEKHGPYWEKKYVAEADFSITTSSKLKEKLLSYHQKIHLIPNAADISLFQTARSSNFELPYDIKNISPEQQVIGYIGNICHRLDYELLLAIAKKYSHCKLVMVGPIKANNEVLNQLKAMENTLFTGAKPLQELPKYLQRFDCGLIPFLSNKLTASIYPLKINEYLASGTQVVSSSFSEDIKDFESVIHLSNTQDEFVKNIEKALLPPTQEWKEKSLNFVINNNWENRANQLLELIKSYQQDGQKIN
jgi:hypothetical protein